MAEAFETDAICVGDPQMVMKGEPMTVSVLSCLRARFPDIFGLMTEAGSLDLPFDLLELMGCSYIC